MLAALYLLSLLLIWVVPHLFVGQAFVEIAVAIHQDPSPVRRSSR